MLPLLLPPSEEPWGEELRLENRLDDFFQELGLSSPDPCYTRFFPFSIKLIDEEAKKFQITLGDPKATNITFTISPEGIFTPEGTLIGDYLEIELDGQQFGIQIENEEGSLELTILPKEGHFPITGNLARRFTLGDFRGEVRLETDAENPALHIKLENPNHFRASAEIEPEKIFTRGVLIWGNDGEHRLEVKSFEISEDGIEIEGETRMAINDIYTVTLKLGEDASLAITPEEVKQEMIEDVVTALLNDEMVRAHFRRNNPRITEEEMRMVLEYMVFKAEKDLGEILARVASGQRSITVPESLQFFLNLSSQPHLGEKIAEVVLPVITGLAALEFNAYQDIKEAKIVLSAGDIRDEEGNDRLLWSIGVEDRNGEILGVVTIVDSTYLSSVKVATSFARGLQAVAFKAGGLEIELSREYIEIGSAESTHYTQAFAIFQELWGKPIGTRALEWNFRYSYDGKWELKFTRTLPSSSGEEATQDENNDTRRAEFSFILGYNGSNFNLDFGLKVPFLGGTLEVNPQEQKIVWQFEIFIENPDKTE
jgi:hypothetical protein